MGLKASFHLSLFTVKAGSFDPKPKVDSAVIRFDLYDKPPVKPLDKTILFSVIRAAFSQRRKTLINSLSSYFGTKVSKQDLAKVITECGFTDTVRGEELDIFAFSNIADGIYKKLN